MRNILLGLFLLTLSSIATAQKVSIHGLGNNTCGEAMQQIARVGLSAETGYADWPGGFINGYSAATSDARKVDTIVGFGISFDTLTALFKNKCGQEPTKPVMQTAKEIYQELNQRQKQ